MSLKSVLLTAAISLVVVIAFDKAKAGGIKAPAVKLGA